MVAGGGATNIVHADQSIKLNEHYLTFNIADEDEGCDSFGGEI